MTNQRSPIYVFDLDGVITDPNNTEVNGAVVDAMYQLLAGGTYVAVNTGRSFDWVEKNLGTRLESRQNDDIFHRFVVACEKGGEMITWDDGKPTLLASEFALTQEARELTKAIFEQNKSQLQTMLWDGTKRTMATIAKKPAASLDVFHAEQDVLIEKLSSALSGYEARVDPTTAATDVESPDAGKHAGAELIYDWVKAVTGTASHSFISIGDSASDYEMARYFADQDATESTFVYVGNPTDKIIQHDQVTFVVTENHFAIGALEFLNKK